MDFEMANFGEYLKQLRKGRKRTQESVAKALGVSNAYIHQLEAGKMEAPTERRCEQLAEVLDIPFDKIWPLAQRDRLEHFAKREGIELGSEQSAEKAIEQFSVMPLDRTEELLVQLYRRLDDETRKDFNGLVVMLLRHYPEAEVQERLQEFLSAA